MTASAPAPFVIRTKELVVDVKMGRVKPVTRYYLWLFTTIKLPIELEAE
jgi:hypothetical protein